MSFGVLMLSVVLFVALIAVVGVLASRYNGRTGHSLAQDESATAGTVESALDVMRTHSSKYVVCKRCGNTKWRWNNLYGVFICMRESCGNMRHPGEDI